MMRVVIFGATGFIGSHVAEQMVLAGHEVDCIVRVSSDTRFLETLDLNITAIDFNSDEELIAAISQGDIVCNCVADTRMHISTEERRVVEVALTSRLYRAAQEAGVRRFIQLSTVMVYGFDRPRLAIDESFVGTPHYSYNRVAVEREQALLQLAADDPNREYDEALELVILRPSNTIGKRDTSFLPNMRGSHRQGFFPFVSGGEWQFSLMDTRDIGRAMVHLLDVPVTEPEIYLVKGFDTNWRGFKAALDGVLGKTSKAISIPKSLMKFFGWLFETCYQYGKEPPLTRFSVDVLSTDTLFDDSKIRGTGFTPEYDLRQMLEDAIEQSGA